MKFIKSWSNIVLNIVLIIGGLFAGQACAANFVVQKNDRGVKVELDGQLFTQYHIASGTQPILWPIIGPDQKEMTRGFPMRELVEPEKADHAQHRSLWFSHGDVNGLSFGDDNARSGVIKHRRFEAAEGGQRAQVVTVNEWLGPRGAKICWDRRSYTFAVSDHGRLIDVDIELHPYEEPVRFGDTKEGTLGIRVAGTMAVDAGLGGRIVTGKGAENADAWGTRASWVDYHGPVDGDTVGIAVMNHPTSFRFPTFWHVRTYGLLAANVFGERSFTNSESADGSYVLERGASLAFRYRILLHRGDEKQGHVAESFAEYIAAEYIATDKNVDGD